MKYRFLKIITNEQESNMINDTLKLLTYTQPLLLRPVSRGLGHTCTILGPVKDTTPHIFLLKS